MRISIKARRRAARALAAVSSVHLLGMDTVDAAELIDADSEASKSASRSALSSSEEVLEPMKVDSHEDRARARYRLVNAKAPVLLAMTYAEFGKAGSKDAAAMKSAAEKVSLDAGGGDDVSRQLAKAGAIKDVSHQANAASTTDDVDDEKARQDEASLRATGEDAATEGGAKPAADSEAQEDDADDDDTGSDLASVTTSIASSTTAGSQSVAGARAAVASIAFAAPDELTEASSSTAGVISRQLSGSVGAGTDARRGISCRASFIKATGFAPGMLQLYPHRICCLVATRCE